MKTFVKIFALLLCLFPGIAIADEAAPLLYTRANIIIKRAQAPSAELLPWQKPEEAMAAPDLVLDVEVRDATTLYNQQGWYNLSSPSDRNGVLLVFSAPTLAPIAASSQYVPLDVLMIDKEGTIKEIAPNLMLSELAEDIYPKAPVLAFLFMKSGACAKQSINPGDSVEYKIFRKPPAVLSAPDSGANQ